MRPWLIRNILFPGHELLLRRPTLRLLRQLQDPGPASPEAIGRYQLGCIRSLSEHARNTTAFWRQRLPAPEILARAEDLPSALAVLPLLTRTDIAAHREEMRWRQAPGKVLTHASSGTTDDNLVFYFDRSRQAWDRALRMRALQRFGVYAGERQLHFWPKPKYRDAWNRLKEPMRALRDRIRQGSILDLRPLCAERLDRALDLLESFRPRVVVVYPSWLAALAARALETCRKPAMPELSLILCEGELLYDFQRALITRAFGARLAEEYGSHDAGIIANEDPAGRWLMNWEHVCLEIIRDGHPARPGEMGEVVITNLHSQVMPFIRYATGDVGIMPARPAQDSLPLVMPKIEGRTSDVLLCADGRLLPHRGLVEELVRATGSASFFLYQPRPGHIVCMTTRAGGWLGREREVEAILRAGLGGVEIAWSVGAFFQPLQSGKRRFVCSPAAHALLAHDKEAGLALARAWQQELAGAG